VVVAATKSTPSTKPISSPTEVHILVLDGRTGRMVRDIALRTTRTTGVQPSLGDQPAAAGMDTVTRNLFVALTNGRVVTINLDRGAVIRETRLGYFQVRGMVLDDHTSRVFVSGIPRRHGSPIGLSVLDAQTGALLPTPGMPLAGAELALDGRLGRVLAVDFVGRADSLSATTGRLVHGVKTRTVVDGFGPMAIDTRNGHAVVPTSFPVGVMLLDVRSGQVLKRTIYVGVSPLAVAIDRTQHRAFVQDTRGNTVYVLDTGTGAVLGHLALGKPVNSTFGGVSVDTHTHWAFVFAPGHMVVLNTAAWPG
jgi:DNA-binding beta-propeller fold protein YncE